MKHIVKATLALILVLTIAASVIGALATEPIMYVNTKTLKVYKQPDRDSKVIMKLKGGQSVMLSGNVLTGSKFTSILIADKKHDGQMECFVLSKYLSDTVPQEYCKHEWGKWKVSKEATCTEDGKRARTCKICGKKASEKIKKLGHEWGKWKVTKEATCTKKGTRQRKCAVCGSTEKEEYYEDHEWGKWKVTKEATCTEKGAREHKCKVCGTVETQALDMVPHDYEYVVTTEATDHSAGVRSKICKVCGKNGGEESFDPEGTLRRGAKGEAVRAMQQLLVEQGYLNAGGADGAFGGGTEKALMKYQQDRNLNPDGIAWPQTLVDLEHDYGPWEIVKPMTRSEAGERMRVCRGCGYEQYETVEPGTTYERGDRGESIRTLQQIVKVVGYDAGSFDGIYGKKLDAAMAGFAAANGLEVEEGEVRPADVDALVNAWFALIPAEEWKGEGDTDTPVNLALSVTPNGEPDETGIQNYSWMLTNLGSDTANFTALLLTFGDDPDFTRDNLVMAIDGFHLKSDAGNEVSGSFSIDAAWGKGNLNFAALAVSEEDSGKWLSNVVTFENDASPAEKTVAPVAQAIDVNNLPDGEYPVSFDRGDVFSGASGVYINAAHIYTRDWYDIVDVTALKAGDTLVVSGEEVAVQSVEETEYGVLVNGDRDDSILLATDEDANGFCVLGLDDMTTYTEQGVTTLVIDPAATFTDAWDIEAEPATVGYDAIVDTMQSSENSYFTQYNTTVRVEGGKVVEIDRVYVP